MRLHFEIIYEIYSLYISPVLWFTGCCGAICYLSSQEHRGEPLLFSIYTGFFYLHYTTHGTNRFHPIQRMKQWLSSLPKDTSVTTGTRIHTLQTFPTAQLLLRKNKLPTKGSLVETVSWYFLDFKTLSFKITH